MAYVPNEWECGDVITAEGLNNMEEGIQEALDCCEQGGSSKPLLIYSADVTMNAGLKIWQTDLSEEFILTQDTILMVVFDDKAEFLAYPQESASMSGSYYILNALSFNPSDSKWFRRVEFHANTSIAPELPFAPNKIDFNEIDSTIGGINGHLMILQLA